MGHREQAAEPARTGVLVARFEGIVDSVDEEAASTLAALVGSVPGPALLVWGPELSCLSYNHRFRGMSGVQPAALGEPLFAHCSDLEAALRPGLEDALAGVATRLEEAFVGRASEGPFQGCVVPAFGASGVPAGALAMLWSAGGSRERTSRLIGMAAHDLRDPVLGVRLLAQRLARAPGLAREKLVEELARIASMAEHMERIIDDLGAFSRLTNGFRLDPRPADLASLVRAACDALAVLTPSEQALEDDGPLSVRGTMLGGRPQPESPPGQLRVGPLEVRTQEVFGLWDADAIRRIVVNLVTNARKHGPEGAPVAVAVTRVNDYAIIDVTDLGSGIAAQDVERLFEPWRRGRSEIDGGRPGAGLGLTIVRELVTAQGGKVTCERASPTGFTMRVTLPVPGSGVFRAPERPRS
jgi:signal transduction histidine kinase